MTLAWRTREPPLAPVAVLARGAAVAALARATAAALGRGADLAVASGPDHLLVLGDAPDLPWTDGAAWLGRDRSLLLPTTVEPVTSADLVEAAVVRRAGPAGLHVLLPDAILVGLVPVGPPASGVLDALAVGS